MWRGFADTLQFEVVKSQLDKIYLRCEICFFLIHEQKKIAVFLGQLDRLILNYWLLLGCLIIITSVLFLLSGWLLIITRVKKFQSSKAPAARKGENNCKKFYRQCRYSYFAAGRTLYKGLNIPVYVIFYNSFLFKI